MNKQELFTFLSNKTASSDWQDGKQIFITSGITVAGTNTNHTMLPCNHKEVDTRILIHLLDGLEHGSPIYLVCTVDMDAVGILIGKFHALFTKYPAADIWVDFGIGKNYTYLHINAICHARGKDKSMALPLFHRL